MPLGSGAAAIWWETPDLKHGVTEDTEISRLSAASANVVAATNTDRVTEDTEISRLSALCSL